MSQLLNNYQSSPRAIQDSTLFRRGKQNKVFTGFIDIDQEVTSLKYLSSCKAFIIGTYHGLLRIQTKMSENVSKSLHPHSKQITSINYDSSNHLFITSSCDSNVYIQKQKGNKYQLIRSIKDNYFKKEVSLCEVSVYHNLIVVGAAQEKMVYIWDYQFCKLLGEVQLKDGSEPTVLSFINGYSMLVIGDNFNQVSIIEIKYSDTYQISLNLVCLLNVQQVPTHFLFDAKSSQKLFVGVKKGKIWQIDLSSILSKYSPQKPTSSRQNYNAERQLNESFISEYGKKIFKTISIQMQCPLYTINQTAIKSFKAHQDDITSLIMLSLKQKTLCTCSIDRRIKIWSSSGDLLCDTNINKSLPYKWNIETSNQQFFKERIMFALKTLEVIVNKNKLGITKQSNTIQLNNFFKTLMDDRFITQPIEQKDVDLFDKDDVDYEKYKKYYFKQIGGPRLKQMEAKKRTRSIQNNLKLVQLKADEEKLKVLEELKLKKVKIEQKQMMLQMFKNPNQIRNNIMKLENKQILLKIQRLLNKPSFEGQHTNKENQPLSTIHHKEMRINRHRPYATKKHISFQQYYQSKRNIEIPNESIKPPQTASSQCRWNKETFGKVLGDLNEKLKWKRLLHTRSYDRKSKPVAVREFQSIE